MVEKICRDAVDVLRGALGVEVADVVVDAEPKIEGVEADDLF